jgi:hypothetical protein
MKKFVNVELRLGKSVKKGDKESLLSLFSVAERFKRMQVLANADEDTIIKVVLEGLGEANLKLGNDMEKGQQKAIMTLFWYSERSKPFEMMTNVRAGESITINMWVGAERKEAEK